MSKEILFHAAPASSAQTRPLTGTHTGPQRTAQPIRAVAAMVFRTIGLWAFRRQSRRRLAELPPHLLRDIGVDEARAWREATKPFWKG